MADYIGERLRMSWQFAHGIFIDTFLDSRFLTLFFSEGMFKYLFIHTVITFLSFLTKKRKVKKYLACTTGYTHKLGFEIKNRFMLHMEMDTPDVLHTLSRLFIIRIINHHVIASLWSPRLGYLSMTDS